MSVPVLLILKRVWEERPNARHAILSLFCSEVYKGPRCLNEGMKARKQFQRK